MQEDRTEKECRICGETKPLTSFAPNRKMSDGRLHQCRVCLQAKEKARRADDPERYLARRRARYAANRPAENARTNAWKQAHPGHNVKSRLTARRPGTWTYAPGFSYTDVPEESVDYGLLLLNDPCSYCGGPAGELDHITPLAGGGTHDWWNLTASCRSCNRRKNDRTVLDVLMRLIIIRLVEDWAPRLGEDQRLLRKLAA
jgi:5-methylcytosine-specific restriction endonuclease McrA